MLTLRFGFLRAFLPVLFFTAALFSVPLCAAKEKNGVSYEISGLDDAQEENARLFLQTLPAITATHWQRDHYLIERAIVQSQQALGYYHIRFKIEPDPDNHNTLHISVTAGPPVHIRNLEVKLEGEGRDESLLTGVIAQSPLKQGTVLNHGEYDSLKSELMSHLQTLGFFDARVLTASVRVYPDENSADIKLLIDTGPRYRFGNIRIDSSSPSIQTLVLSFITFKPGDPFDARTVGKINSELISSGYFNLINIQPLTKEPIGQRVPVHVQAEPNSGHEIQTGVGYSTDEGPRLSLEWNTPLLSDSGSSQSSKVLLSPLRGELTTSYKVPFGHPLEQFYDIQAGYQFKNNEDIDTHLLTTAINRWQKDATGWDQNRFVQLHFESYRQGKEVGNDFLAIPGILLERQRFQGNRLSPDHGFRLSFKTEFSSTLLGAEEGFVQLWGSAKYLKTFGKHQFITRAEQGLTAIKDIQGIPPSIRFFAGGDQSIRGFSYESIAPTDEQGNLAGGRYLTTASGEYSYEFINDWRLALFVDTGTATNDYQQPWQVGAGTGVRWITPFGALKVDVANALSQPNHPWRLHISIGPEL